MKIPAHGQASSEPPASAPAGTTEPPAKRTEREPTAPDVTRRVGAQTDLGRAHAAVGSLLRKLKGGVSMQGNGSDAMLPPNHAAPGLLLAQGGTALEKNLKCTLMLKVSKTDIFYALKQLLSV